MIYQLSFKLSLKYLFDKLIIAERITNIGAIHTYFLGLNIFMSSYTCYRPLVCGWAGFSMGNPIRVEGKVDTFLIFLLKGF